MTDVQRSKQKRNGIIEDVFNRYPAEVQSVQMLASKVVTFSAVNKAIAELHPAQEHDSTGVTEGKNATRADIALTGFAIAGALHSYAHDNTNADLAKRMDLPLSAFTHGSVAKFKKLCLEVVTEAKSCGEKIVPYGVSAELLQQFEEQSSGFTEVANKPRNETVKKSAATKQMAALFAEADEIIYRHFDKLILGFIKSCPGLYREYMSARIIEDQGSRGGSKNPPSA